MPQRKTIALILQWAEFFIVGNFGYSKPHRWDGLKSGKAHSPGSFDCTSIIGAILFLAGYIPLALIQGTWWSGNIANKLEAAGWRRVSAKGKSLAWLNANVTAGSVLVGVGHGVLGLGDGWILSWEYSEHGTGDGKVGRQGGERVGKRRLYLRSKGWDDLLLPPPDPSTPPAETPGAELAFRGAMCAQQAVWFGGSRDYAARGREIAKLGASVAGLTETLGKAKGEKPWSMRAGINKVLNGWARAVAKKAPALCLMWDTRKWAKKGQTDIRFGPKSDPWHGALRVTLYRKDARQLVDFIVVHVRPGTVATIAQKRADVAQVLTLVRPGVPTVVLGDFAQDPDAQLGKAGFIRASLKADSYDKAGKQFIDGVYIDAALASEKPVMHNPGINSDHRWPTVRILRRRNNT